MNRAELIDKLKRAEYCFRTDAEYHAKHGRSMQEHKAAGTADILLAAIAELEKESKQ